MTSSRASDIEIILYSNGSGVAVQRLKGQRTTCDEED